MFKFVIIINSNLMAKKNIFEIPNSIIRTGQLLQFFSSSLAANFAMKLFATPPKFEIPEREKMMRESAKNELITVPEVQKQVMVYEYGYSKIKVLLAHGWAGRGTQLYEIADKLLENGMMVISFDAPAHGLSKGKTANFPEYIATLKHLNEKYGPFEAAIGHSFGGINLLNVLSKAPFVNKLIVIGIEGSNDKIVDLFIQKLQLKPKVALLMKKQMETKFKIKTASTSAIETAKKVMIPTLVIHDTEDYDVDVSTAYKVRQSLKNGLLLITNGLGHRRILRDHTTIHKMIDFIKI
ncbi:MAG TPA: alpha/beta hydrolase [Flavobacteriaceae bacterium]|nr:alpha/beta hydrolase [Flavobacteriaceae bacterium]HBS13285.1 alpha/beta hydrolase [Flavobacteriaceae bacterium]